MAILVALISKLSHLVSSYVLASDNTSADPNAAAGNPYSMPFLYIIVLACMAVLGYFLWQSYRQEIHEEKLQERVALKDEKFSTYNLTWVNKLMNWAYISSPPQLPEAVKRWIEDLNINLAQNKSPLKVLIYGLREGSMSPWIREVGEVRRLETHVEVPVMLESPEFGFTLSVQEEDKGKVIASTYSAIVAQFKCWYTAILSRVDGNVLLKLEFNPDRPKVIDFRMKCLSDQQVASTVPEVLADLIKTTVLTTPFYMNVSTWGAVLPMNMQRPISPKRKRRGKDTNGNTIHNTEQSGIRNRKELGMLQDSGSTHPTSDTQNILDNGDIQVQRSATMPSNATPVKAEQLKSPSQNLGLSGSLGSLVGIKRTPSGRGPAKPIRSREKQLVMKVVRACGLPTEGVLYCKATLDYPSQQCRTNTVQSGSDQLWSDDKLNFDLSFRSSEVKLVVYKKLADGQEGEDSPVASAVLLLDRINIEQPSEQVLPLKTMSKDDASLTLQLAFAENPVESNLVKHRPSDTPQKSISLRRSLDMSNIANNLPHLVNEKEDAKLTSRSSAFSSSDNVSQSSPEHSQTTVTTTTRRKVTPVKESSKTVIPVSQSAPSIHNMHRPQLTSDVSKVAGSVADIAVNDLSKEAKILEQSPELKGQIKKGRLVITAVSKSKIDDDQPEPTDEPMANGTENEEGEEEGHEKNEKVGEEMYYSMCSLTTPGSDSTQTEEKHEQTALLPKEKLEAALKEGQEPEPQVSEVKPKKQRRKRDKRPKSMVAGVRPEEVPNTEPEKDWPKVRRSRSLIFGKGRKKHYKTGSTTELNKYDNTREDIYPGGYEGDSPVTVPENDLQKYGKKKKSRSISKLFSKLGRKPSLRKAKKETDIVETKEPSPLSARQNDSVRVATSSNNVSFSSDHPNYENPGRKSPSSSDRPNSSVVGSESDSFISEMTPSSLSPSLSHNSSLTGERSEVKRSKSLRKRLFGGKRKTSKN